jgi:hypothetical protein
MVPIVINQIFRNDKAESISLQPQFRSNQDLATEGEKNENDL